MISVAQQWNPKQALLKNSISKSDKFEEAMMLTLQLHSMVHASEMSGTCIKTFEDDLWDGLDEIAFKTMPTTKNVRRFQNSVISVLLYVRNNMNAESSEKKLYLFLTLIIAISSITINYFYYNTIKNIITIIILLLISVRKKEFFLLFISVLGIMVNRVYAPLGPYSIFTT